MEADQKEGYRSYSRTRLPTGKENSSHEFNRDIAIQVVCTPSALGWSDTEHISHYINQEQTVVVKSDGIFRLCGSLKNGYYLLVSSKHGSIHV